MAGEPGAPGGASVFVKMNGDVIPLEAVAGSKVSDAKVALLKFFSGIPQLVAADRVLQASEALPSGTVQAQVIAMESCEWSQLSSATAWIYEENQTDLAETWPGDPGEFRGEDEHWPGDYPGKFLMTWNGFRIGQRAFGQL